MPMPVSVTEKAALTAARRRASSVSAAPARPGQADADAHLAALGELERVGEQVLQDLAEALGVGDDVVGHAGRDVDRVVEALALGDVLELAEQVGAQVARRRRRPSRR